MTAERIALALSYIASVAGYISGRKNGMALIDDALPVTSSELAWLGGRLDEAIEILKSPVMDEAKDAPVPDATQPDNDLWRENVYLRSVATWTPAKYAKPNDDRDVLVRRASGSIARGFCSGDMWFAGAGPDGKFAIGVNDPIAYWAELPKDYEGEKE